MQCGRYAQADTRGSGRHAGLRCLGAPESTVVRVATADTEEMGAECASVIFSRSMSFRSMS